MTLETHAFTMRLHPGAAEAYKARHDAIWPELSALLREAGIETYTIHLDPASGVLFAVMRRRPDHGVDALPHHPVMRRWWAHMADLMETNPDESPVVTPLLPVFEM